MSRYSTPQLGAAAIQAAIADAGVEASAIDEVVMGSILQAGQGQAPAIPHNTMSFVEKVDL